MLEGSRLEVLTDPARGVVAHYPDPFERSLAARGSSLGQARQRLRKEFEGDPRAEEDEGTELLSDDAGKGGVTREAAFGKDS